MHLKSDKKGRLYMCIDSNLLAAVNSAAKESGLSLEEKVEQILRQAVERRIKLFKLFSTLTTEQRIFVLGYAKGLADENEQAHGTDSPKGRSIEQHGSRKRCNPAVRR